VADVSIAPETGLGCSGDGHFAGRDSKPFFTIGHSTRSIQAFIGLLREAEANFVVDVRTVPRSRTNPQFNREVLPESLADHMIGYEHMPALGGLRGKRRGDEASPNTFWQNDSFRNYADYALTEPFRRGLEFLLEIGSRQRCAIMCAEAVWWRCHRRIVADYLIVRGATVFHLMGPSQIEPASLTPSAQRGPNGLIYKAR
jgi:uncharacterized protein (DUF488 family)